jgi:ribosomal protein S19
MSRSSWKGYFVDKTIEKIRKSKEFNTNVSIRKELTDKIEILSSLEKNALLEQLSTFRVWARNSVIPFFLKGETISVHNGKNFKELRITEEHVGYKFGEFVFTRFHGGHKSKKKDIKKGKSKAKSSGKK